MAIRHATLCEVLKALHWNGSETEWSSKTLTANILPLINTGVDSFGSIELKIFLKIV